MYLVYLHPPTYSRACFGSAFQERNARPSHLPSSKSVVWLKVSIATGIGGCGVTIGCGAQSQNLTYFVSSHPGGVMHFMYNRIIEAQERSPTQDGALDETMVGKTSPLSQDWFHRGPATLHDDLYPKTCVCVCL